jgi:hypothetical protein
MMRRDYKPGPGQTLVFDNDGVCFEEFADLFRAAGVIKVLHDSICGVRQHRRALKLVFQVLNGHVSERLRDDYHSRQS